MMWKRPALGKKCTSAFDGCSTPLGWEWQDPAIWVESGIISKSRDAESSPVKVPGSRFTSSMTPPLSVNTATNSFGWASRPIWKRRLRSSCRIPWMLMVYQYSCCGTQKRLSKYQCSTFSRSALRSFVRSAPVNAPLVGSDMVNSGVMSYSTVAFAGRVKSRMWPPLCWSSLIKWR